MLYNRFLSRYNKGLYGLIFFSFSIIFCGYALGQSIVAPTVLESEVKVCEERQIAVDGGTQTKLGVQQLFALQSDIPAREIISISHEIWKGSNNLAIYQTSSFSHGFEDLGQSLIKTLVTTRNGCTYVSQVFVYAYEHIYIYIGPGSDEFSLAKESFQQPGTLFKEITIGQNSFQNEDLSLTTLIENASLIDTADSIIVDSQILGVFLSAIPKVKDAIGVTWENPSFYVVSTINQSAFRRLVGTYRSLFGIKNLSVIPSNNVGSLISALLLNKSPNELGLVKTFTVDTTGQSKWQFMSYFIDTLLFHSAPLGIIILLLLLPCLVLVITFFRQIVGFTTYGIYNPLIVAFGWHILGGYAVLTVLAIAFITLGVVTYITKKLHLLSSSKSSLRVSIYCFLLLCVLVIQAKYGLELFDLQQLTNPYTVFVLIFMLLVGSSIFKDPSSIITKKRLIRLVQFLIVSGILVWLIRYSVLHNILLGYPEIIFAVIIGILMIGRFTGLQVTEYFRFLPLIMRTMRDEEEE